METKKPKERKIYMIRRRHDGLYSTGGSWPNFTHNGKMWGSMGSLNAHLTNIYSGNGWEKAALKRGEDGRYSQFDFGSFADMRNNPYINCDVVEAELTFQVKSDVFNHLALRYYKEETPETEENEEDKTS